MQETQVGTLGREDPLEEEMATLSSIPWDSPMRTEDLLRLQSLGSHIVGQDWHAGRDTLTSVPSLQLKTDVHKEV